MSVHLAISDAIAVVTIDRQHRLNALDEETLRSLEAAWREVDTREDVSVAILTGAGDRAFCAGADLRDYIGEVPDPAWLWQAQRNLRLDRNQTLWKPVIGAVNGACIGGGVTLLLATDIRIASEHATFALPEVKWGLLASCGGTQRLMRAIPSSAAMEMLLTGDTVDARRALEIGLVSKVLPADQLMEEAIKLARRIVSHAPLAVRATKELALRAHDLPLDAGIRLEDAFGQILQQTPEVSARLSGFVARKADEPRTS